MHNTKQKRLVVILIPFYIDENGNIHVFLQKRKIDAKRLPGYFGFFGGGIEANESSEDALKRETKEELGIDVSDYSFFNHYEFYGSIRDVYMKEVSNSFNNDVIIGEGEYGKFFTEAEAMNERMIYPTDKLILWNFFAIKKGSYDSHTDVPKPKFN